MVKVTHQFTYIRQPTAYSQEEFTRQFLTQVPFQRKCTVVWKIISRIPAGKVSHEIIKVDGGQISEQL
jgi:hypothetical protein